MSKSVKTGASHRPPAAEIGVDGAPTSPGLNPWILNGWQDLVFFVATPLLIIPLIAILQRYWTVADIALYVVSFGALGHHLPGMMRAYGDRELFARFRVRFIVAPLFLLAVCNFFAHGNLNGLSVLLLFWGTWHGAAQIYGFLRIYDAKARSFSPVTAKLDMAMCLAWFGLGLLYSPDRMASILKAFYDSGGPLMAASMVQTLTTTWTVATAAVTAAFLVNWVRQWRQGRPPNTAKLLLMISTFGFWWYTMISINNIILGVAMFEIFHDVQYLAIVWVYNVKRVQTGHRVGALTRFLFRRSWYLAGLYAGLVFAYGYINLFAGNVKVEDLQLSLFGLITASTFLHFYYDGFIWKVREKSTREGLGLSGGQSEQGDLPMVPTWLRHGLYWSLFVVPLALLGSAELRGVRSEIERGLAIVEAVPHSANAHNNLAKSLQGGGRTEEAVTHYQQTLRIKPDFAEAHNNLGLALQNMGRVKEAMAHYQDALRIKADFAEAHNNLGLALQNTGRIEEALAHYHEALKLKPDFAEAHSNLGLAFQQRGRFDEAIAHYQEALRIKPDFAKAHYNLGLAWQLQGRSQEAMTSYHEALRLDPNYAEAHNNLGCALYDLGRSEEAIAHYQDALRIKPDYADAHNNLAWLWATFPDHHIRDGQRALEHAKRAVGQAGENNSSVLETLSAAYAELGNFDEAVRWQEKAVQMAPNRQKDILRGRLELYKQGRPYREKPESKSDK